MYVYVIYANPLTIITVWSLELVNTEGCKIKEIKDKLGVGILEIGQNFIYCRQQAKCINMIFITFPIKQ